MNLPFERIGIAILIGALIGIEREKRQREEGDENAAGLRTFILLAMAGALSAWLALDTDEMWIFVGAGLASAMLILAGYLSHVRVAPQNFGLTTEVAALVTFLLGGTAVFTYPLLAVALAIATSAVLAFRRTLHGLVERLGWNDIFAGLKLLIVIFIVLPVVPRYPVDPWGALNPYSLTWLVILIAGISFLGYVASRWMGAGRGAAVTGLVGGLVSSTAVTLSLARRSREATGDAEASALAAGVLLSWMVMFVRVVIEAAVVNPSLVTLLAIPMGSMALIATAGALLLLRRHDGVADGNAALALKNPFSLSFAIKFAALLAAITLLVELASDGVPGAGVYLVAAVAGIADVDAITLSLAGKAKTGPAGPAVAAIAVAVLSNTLVKCGFVYWIADARMRRRVAPTAIVIAIAAVASVVVLLI